MTLQWILVYVTDFNFVIQLLVTANVVPRSLILFILMMEAIRSSETSVLTIATRRHIPSPHLHSHCREQLKTYRLSLPCPRNSALFVVRNHVSSGSTSYPLSLESILILSLTHMFPKWSFPWKALRPIFCMRFPLLRSMFGCTQCNEDWLMHSLYILSPVVAGIRKQEVAPSIKPSEVCDAWRRRKNPF
jgi:hypothetical protein